MFVTSPFFSRLYAETLGLLVEARNYSFLINVDGLQGYPPRVQTKIVHESLRVTSRLTQVMAWLLYQKAIQNGEISWIGALSEDQALSKGEVFDDQSHHDSIDIPYGLRSLLSRSYSLYQRVSRLDAQLLNYQLRLIAC